MAHARRRYLSVNGRALAWLCRDGQRPSEIARPLLQEDKAKMSRRQQGAVRPRYEPTAIIAHGQAQALVLVDQGHGDAGRVAMYAQATAARRQLSRGRSASASSQARARRDHRAESLNRRPGRPKAPWQAASTACGSWAAPRICRPTSAAVRTGRHGRRCPEVHSQRGERLTGPPKARQISERAIEQGITGGRRLCGGVSQDHLDVAGETDQIKRRHGKTFFLFARTRSSRVTAALLVRFPL